MANPSGTQHVWSRLAALAAGVAVTFAAHALPAQLRESVPADKARPAPLGAIASMTHEVKPFGKTNDGQEVSIHTLTNLNGMRVRLINYGATLIGVETPDRGGKNANI